MHSDSRQCSTIARMSQREYREVPKHLTHDLPPALSRVLGGGDERGEPHSFLDREAVPERLSDGTGRVEWRLDGLRHHATGPAVVGPRGVREWWMWGLVHREDGPAILTSEREEYLQFGRRHREDGPAIIGPAGMRAWYLDGRMHRVGGPALVMPNGYREYRLFGELHRVDGPAVIHPDGREEYFHYGLRHRADGPAITGPGIAGQSWIAGRRVASGLSSGRDGV